MQKLYNLNAWFKKSAEFIIFEAWVKSPENIKK